jgi:hypothetical protein
VKKIIYIFVFIACGFAKSFSQSDSVAFSNDFVLKEGVYLSYTDFRKNMPVPKDAIQSKEDKTQLDFISKMVSDNKEIIILYNGTENKLETKKLWGYCQNNAVYLNYEGKFYRVPVFGNISHFLGTVEVYNYNNYGMYGGMYGGMGGGMYGPSTPIKQREMRQFIFDFYSGEIMDYTLSNVEILVSRDMKLYEEFMQMKKSKRRDMMMMYVRKFNLAHPIYFPAK